jgi:hypothetical protein
MVEECKDADDYSEELDLLDDYYMDRTRDYWYAQSQATSTLHSDNAAHLGIKGRFKEKKNPYKLRD